MASSDVEICNRALDAIGARTITALGQDTREGGLCRRYYPQVRDEVLRSHPWNCAMARAQLSADVTPPAYGAARRFPLPADCLRVFEVEGESDASGAWQVESGAVVTNIGSPLQVRYVRRVTETGLLDPMLVAVIAARLAMELARPLAGSDDVRQAMRVEFRDTMRAARSADGQEGTVRQLQAEDFARSRL